MADQLIINPFDENGFDLATVTTSLSLLPNTYGRIREMGIFSHDPIRTNTAVFDIVDGLISLLKSEPRGAKGNMMKHDKSKMRSLIAAHIPVEDVIFPSDLAGIRNPGTMDMKTLETEMLKRLVKIRSSFAITEEHLLMGAVKGIVLDADGSTLQNLYTIFEISQKIVSFALTTPSTDVKKKCREVVRHIEDNLRGDVMSGVHCLCSEEFFDLLIEQDSVKEIFINHTSALEIAGVSTDPRKGFYFGGITFEEYRAKATAPDGTSRRFIAAGDAHFFPVGTQDSFKIHHAPADYFETVGTYGLPMYAKQVMSNDGKRIDVLAESNPLPVCRRPGVLVKGTTPLT